MRTHIGFVLSLALVGSTPSAETLPPLAPWDGPSRNLARPPDDPWATPFERSRLTRTPPYDETVRWLRRLADASPDLDLVSIGTSAEGRDIWMVVASRAKNRSPAGLRESGKPIVLAQAGIHAGEIDGKDAGMMLLRDLTMLPASRQRLDRVHFLFVPILNVDGHERTSSHGRINQRGPEETGWRTNGRNLNLNRDYMKAETEEIRAILAVILQWRPDLCLDLHVTDGADYQYDITWGMTPPGGWSGHIASWIESVLAPALEDALVKAGHVPGPFVWMRNGRDVTDGVSVWMGAPRFSNGYGAVRHLPTVLLETHSLKPFDRRVLGTYVFLDTVLAAVGRDSGSLRRAVAADRSLRPDPVVLAWKEGEGSTRRTGPFLGIRSELVESPVTGGPVVRWTGEPYRTEVEFVRGDVPARTVRRPAGYRIPAAWSPVVDTLRRHGIEVERIDVEERVEVESIRLPDAALDPETPFFEGRPRVVPGPLRVERRTVAWPAGSYRAGTDQPLGDLLIMLLEPESPDSLFQWGHLLSVLSRTEYAEDYVMEPIARRMLAEDADLATAFRARLANDAAFAADPQARLDWFYRQSPYFDAAYRLYPIARETSPPRTPR